MTHLNAQHDHPLPHPEVLYGADGKNERPQDSYEGYSGLDLTPRAEKIRRLLASRPTTDANPWSEEMREGWAGLS